MGTESASEFRSIGIVGRHQFSEPDIVKSVSKSPESRLLGDASVGTREKEITEIETHARETRQRRDPTNERRDETDARTDGYHASTTGDAVAHARPDAPLFVHRFRF